MFYFMSAGDFARIATVVEIINTKSHLLTNDDSQTILGWINSGDDTHFDQFCLAVSDEWSDSYPNVSVENHTEIAQIIHSVLEGGM